MWRDLTRGFVFTWKWSIPMVVFLTIVTTGAVALVVVTETSKVISGPLLVVVWSFPFLIFLANMTAAVYLWTGVGRSSSRGPL